MISTHIYTGMCELGDDLILNIITVHLLNQQMKWNVEIKTVFFSTSCQANIRRGFLSPVRCAVLSRDSEGSNYSSSSGGRGGASVPVASRPAAGYGVPHFRDVTSPGQPTLLRRSQQRQRIPVSDRPLLSGDRLLYILLWALVYVHHKHTQEWALRCSGYDGVCWCAFQGSGCYGVYSSCSAVVVRIATVRRNSEYNSSRGSERSTSWRIMERVVTRPPCLTSVRTQTHTLFCSFTFSKRLHLL